MSDASASAPAPVTYDGDWASSGTGESLVRVGLTGEGDLVIEGPAIDRTVIPRPMIPAFLACLRAKGVLS